MLDYGNCILVYQVGLVPPMQICFSHKLALITDFDLFLMSCQHTKTITPAWSCDKMQIGKLFHVIW